VKKDYNGRYVYHACTGIFINGKALLVDPAYVWFGVPHQEYEFENDLRVIGFYTVARNNYAVGFKLIPDWAFPHFIVALSQVYRGQQKEARATLQEGLKFDSTSMYSLYAKAMVEWGDKDWNAVAIHLQQYLILDPDEPDMHYSLATVFQAEDKLKEARDEYRTYLRQDDYPEFADKAREALASINQTLPDTPEHNP
jgi:tetratricopeptide (TPR) repeat protein